MASLTHHLAAVRARIHEVTPHELATRLENARTRPLLIDVREADEYPSGVLDGAFLVPRGLLEQKIEAVAPEAHRPIALYCAGGTRSALAADTLTQLGYSAVTSLAGGITAWREAGLPVVTPRGLTSAQRSRYARQTVLPQVGEAGQDKLLRSRVLIVGAGGLGSPTALYLAAAGVGTLGIVDDDRVDLTNLQRQILHDELSVGRPKTESARDRLARMNRDLELVPIHERLRADNALDLITGWDVVVDGTDNFTTRYLVNDACVLTKTPNVHGAILHFDGQIAVFGHAGGPCYRCLHPAPPPPHLAPNCAEAGVIGAVCGVVGSLQAVEVVKLLVGAGEPLSGRLLSVDLLYGEVRTLKVRRDPDCAVCGDRPTITAISAETWSCGYRSL